MSNLTLKPATQLTEFEFTNDQISLIKATVAKGASNDELRLFLYRAKNLGLDPLKPGQIYFIKYGQNPGTIVVGIDGFRAQANKTGKLEGIKRGVLRDEDGKCLGAWCEVYRSDWKHPAREEASLAEYSTGKAMWAKMPETMIKKVAEAAALRMAFPDELGGIYSDEEMQQAERVVSPAKANHVNAVLSASESEPNNEVSAEVPMDEPPVSPGDYVIQIGKKYRGKKLSEVSRSDLADFVEWVETNVENKNAQTLEFLNNAQAFLELAP